MGILKYCLVVFFCTNFVQAKATSDTTLNFTLHKSIEGNFTNFSLDNLGNIYLITSNNQIKKINQNFDSIGVFNDVRRYGKISIVDATNPLKILVYYKDFATVLILDRFLNNRNTIDLRSQNILQVKALCLSYDNNIWLYDELNTTLNKIDDTGKILLTSTDFRMLFDDVPNPTHLIDANGMLYLYSSNFGWISFDYYGALKNKYPIKNWQDVQVINKMLIGRIYDKLVTAFPQTLTIKNYSTNINLTNAIKVLQNKAYMFVLNNNGLQVYKPKN